MSEYSVEISPSALEDLRAIQTYIATELGSPIAAEKTVQRMLDVLKGLERLTLEEQSLDNAG
jgi:plasmid stabilization system protein ParE